MPFRLYKMGLEAKVAVANMTLVNCALVMILFSLYIESEGWQAAANVARIGIAVLGFPVGWISLLCVTSGGPDVMSFALLAICLTLNAYVWGKVMAAIVRRFKTQKTCPTSGDRDSSCP